MSFFIITGVSCSTFRFFDSLSESAGKCNKLFRNKKNSCPVSCFLRTDIPVAGMIRRGSGGSLEMLFMPGIEYESPLGHFKFVPQVYPRLYQQEQREKQIARSRVQ